MDKGKILGIAERWKITPRKWPSGLYNYSTVDLSSRDLISLGRVQNPSLGTLVKGNKAERGNHD